MADFLFEEQLDWRRLVTPKPLENKPIHRWYIFPHSFTRELVHVLIQEWGLGSQDHILDPFVGAGTTILAAKECGIPATGYDLSPLAVLATCTKIANYNVSRLEKAWKSLQKALKTDQWNGASKSYPQLVEKALPGCFLGAFEAISKNIDTLSYYKAERDFFRLALLSIIPHYSRAVATGGWLKWIEKQPDVRNIPETLSNRVEMMLQDLREVRPNQNSLWHVKQADARKIPDEESTYSAVITSPPYPNRHDYTRIFGVELMFAFLDWEETRKLRYQSIHSHPEARPERPDVNGYITSQALSQVLSRIIKTSNDKRVPAMLEGYFLDMFLCLREVKRVCKSGAKVAFVVGNAQYCGESILVDELTADVGKQAGLVCEKILVVRYRGNSAQQMGKYGRNLSPESIIIFRNH